MSRKPQTIAANIDLKLFKGDGEMPSLMRAYDWASHAMGAPAGWPESLKTAIRLMLQSDFPMFIWWSPELYMFHNDAYLPALGKKHPQALGASARDMWAEIWEQIGGIVEGILQGGKSFYAQELLIILERKGFLEETYWTFSYSPAPNDEGSVGGIFCACSEVTKSVLGQRRLKTIKDIADSTIRVETVEEAGQLASAVLAHNGDDIPFSLIYLLNAEETKATLLGKSGELPGELVLQELIFDHPETVDIWHLAEVRDSRKMITVSLPMSTFQPLADGREPAFAMKAVVLPVLKPGEDKLIGFFVGALSPRLEFDSDYRNFYELLTGQFASSLACVQARQEAARQQEELVNLFEQAPVAIAILRGEQFVVELANPGMCELWGRSHAEVINKPVFEALPEARGQGLEELLREVLTKGIAHVFNEFAVTLKRNDQQQEVYVNFIYYPFRNSKGVITGVIVIAVEVSEQMESRRQMESKNKELIAINADLDNFVYSASHDLKGPILNIEGLMKVLLSKLPAESLQSRDIDKVIQMVFASIDRLKATITDLSEVSRVQKEANEDVKIIHIGEVVKDVLSDMQLDIQQSEARIDTNFHACSVHFSPKNLRSIVYNLLSNAIKYRSENRQPHIRLHCEMKEHYLVFSVTDNGLGMDLKHKNKIFSMFKRLHSHVEGSGVGLYIVKRIVENAGGKIEVESKLGEGSTFRVYFRSSLS
jgi:PAS domain S-box-containing protein